MFRNYFDYNGERYYTGTVFIIKHVAKGTAEATFVCYDTERRRYVYKIEDKKCFWNEQAFYRDIVKVTSRVNNTVNFPQTSKIKDSQINGLALGWMWYIFLMAIVTIFKDNIGLWIIISIIFFSWRAEKIKKEGTYIEW